jgi:hypothetical protein
MDQLVPSKVSSSRKWSSWIAIPKVVGITIFIGVSIAGYHREVESTF